MGEYPPEYGRFMAVDIKSGIGVVQKTLNRYGFFANIVTSKE